MKTFFLSMMLGGLTIATSLCDDTPSFGKPPRDTSGPLVKISRTLERFLMVRPYEKRGFRSITSKDFAPSLKVDSKKRKRR